MEQQQQFDLQNTEYAEALSMQDMDELSQGIPLERSASLSSSSSSSQISGSASPTLMSTASSAYEMAGDFLSMPQIFTMEEIPFMHSYPVDFGNLDSVFDPCVAAMNMTELNTLDPLDRLLDNFEFK